MKLQIKLKDIISFVWNIILVAVASGIAVTFVNTSQENRDLKKELSEYKIEHTPKPEFFYKTPEEGLVEALEYYEIQFPEIVYAQALLETGHFSSSICKNYNNLFGLYNSKIKDYYSFEHWSDSVKAYRDFVQYKYKGNTDYYTFLVNLPYATDPNYIRKIKQLEYKYEEELLKSL
jgi:flagellum-specific peptidoglycan hydrolase FlgJ